MGGILLPFLFDLDMSLNCPKIMPVGAGKEKMGHGRFAVEDL